MKILVIVYIKDTRDITPYCMPALRAQTFQDFSLIIHEMKPVPINADRVKNKSENITRNRNYIRPMALASGAEWIVWLDSDVVMPSNALADFMRLAEENPQKYRLMGGWYRKLASPEWVAALWASTGVLRYFMEPFPGVVEADLIGIGCSMMHRSVLEKLEFRTAVDENVKDMAGHTYYMGNCLSFCEDARKKLGVKSYMVGSIICGHIPPRARLLRRQPSSHNTIERA